MPRKPGQHERRARQGGVVLIIALLMLMILSILASISIRGASSTEQIANQSRQRALAQQAAEAALRYCEQQVQAHEIDASTGYAPVAAKAGVGDLYMWETMSNWDPISPANPKLQIVAFAAAGDAGTVTYFHRPPECMSQYLTAGNSKVFVTTARGFGPEVGAKDGSVPKGTEVWLQSVVTMK
jgi:type IV pilus assembly protein PilX